jgi:hypothetical protein
MGSGKRFRIGLMPYNIVSIGVSVGRKCEHEWSIHIELLVVRIYIGFGKGYEEFDR